MKATGMVRRITELGHFVLPAELRRNMGINVKGKVEVIIDDEMLIIKKYKPACFLCDSTINVKIFKRRFVCSKCIEAIRSLFI